VLIEARRVHVRVTLLGVNPSFRKKMAILVEKTAVGAFQSILLGRAIFLISE